MFKKVLIANRGEIALRIIRSCRALGIETVAVYSEADAHSNHVLFADSAYCVGPARATESYLCHHKVIKAALQSGAEAIHPGYGFLAESPSFARAVLKAGLSFIGPHPDHLELFGDKLSAKRAASAAGLPMLGGSGTAVEHLSDALNAAEMEGYPVILKAAAGGGGKGMRRVCSPDELSLQLELCRREAAAAFGDGRVFIEHFLDAPRHVEVQVAGDGQGGVRHFGTRDCTCQRRYQKVLEEAPAPFLSDRTRAALENAASALIASVAYRTLATVEFLVQGDAFYFMEVNPRIQVEHPVTEQVTGHDLVALQLRLAAGLPFDFPQEQIVLRGHAIEARINAEDPWSFRPSPGRIKGLNLPGGPGIRVDSALYDGAVVPPFYDSLCAKVIATGDTREQAIGRLLGALCETVVDGISTTIPMQLALLNSSQFRSLNLHTRFLDSDTWRVQSASLQEVANG